MILHVFTVTDPNEVGAWPPSLVTSGWVDRLGSYVDSHGWMSRGKTVFVWDNETELNNYVNTYKLTDATLLADLEAWKAAHNITFSTVYYNLSDSDITTPDIVS
jgi:hypothetical protein